METRTLQANPEDAGARLDAWLAGRLPDVTRSAAARLCEEGRVCSAGKPLAKNHRLTGAETVSVALPDPAPIGAAPEDIPLDVVYEDDDVIVVNKPKGLVVHPAPGHPDGTLVNALLHHCGDSLSGIGGALRPGIVHRIDRDTSGLIIAAKNDFAHQRLSAQLQDHTLSRIYRCIVAGNLREDAGTVDAPSAAVRRTGRRWRWCPAAGPPSPTGPCWSGCPAIRMWSAGWRRAAPTRSGSTWPISATPSWGTPCTAIRNPSPAFRASASTPWGCGSSTPDRGGGGALVRAAGGISGQLRKLRSRA